MERETWSSNLDFLLSCVGFAVGLGNIWRFPYLCYKNGGGAFFIPYALFLVFGAAPVLMLEVGLGQYMSQAGYYSWNICPLFQGIGVSTTVIVFLMNIYYIVILAWACYYFVMSLKSVLPWSHCNNPWNTNRCMVFGANSSCLDSFNTSISRNDSASMNLNATSFIFAHVNTTQGNCVDPTVEFWKRGVLELSNSIENASSIKHELAVSLLFVWTVVYFCVWRGVKWTGKVVYFTATFPYVVLVCLLIRGVTLPGATYGIKYFLIPDFSRLADAQVWIDGGTQVLFSLAIALGAMVTLGSYKKFNHNFYRDCFIIMAVNSGTSILGGFVVFSVLGFMATQQGVNISDVADTGAGLAFITYPKAVTEMPLPQVWSALFFFMLFLVGLDSQFVAVEALVTPIIDLFPNKFYKTKRRAMFVAVYCFVSFLLGLSMVTKGGMYIFTLFDYYSASGYVLLWICFWECIVIGWVFGAERFYDAIEMMVGYRISNYLLICWKFITPLVIIAIFIFKVATYKPVTMGANYVYPQWAQAFGVMLALTSMVCLPITIAIKIIKSGESTLVLRVKSQLKPKLMPHQIPAKWTQNRTSEHSTKCLV